MRISPVNMPVNNRQPNMQDNKQPSFQANLIIQKNIPATTQNLIREFFEDTLPKNIMLRFRTTTARQRLENKNFLVTLLKQLNKENGSKWVTRAKQYYATLDGSDLNKIFTELI